MVTPTGTTWTTSPQLISQMRTQWANGAADSRIRPETGPQWIKQKEQTSRMVLKWEISSVNFSMKNRRKMGMMVGVPILTSIICRACRPSKIQPVSSTGPPSRAKTLGGTATLRRTLMSWTAAASTEEWKIFKDLRRVVDMCTGMKAVKGRTFLFEGKKGHKRPLLCQMKNSSLQFEEKYSYEY